MIAMKPITGAAIFDWRRDHNLTQQQAAEILGVAAVTVQSWELGRRNPPLQVGLLIERLRPDDYPTSPGSAGKRPAARTSRRAGKRAKK